MKQELSNEELLALIHQSDEEAKAIFVQKNTPLVYAIVKRFSKQRYNKEDLFQIGCVGLMKAINHFDSSYEVKFSTYAVPIIMGEIKRFFRDDGNIRISRSLKEGYLQMLKCKEGLFQELGYEPTYQQIADTMHLEVSEVLLAFEANQFIYSLDEPIYESDGSCIYLEDKVADSQKKDITMEVSLKKEVHQLKQREQLLLYYRYQLNMKQEAIAQKMGISQVQVSRLEKKILDKLKGKLQPMEELV